MDAFLDNLWFKIIDFLEFMANGMDAILAPLSFLGPAMIILLMVLILVCLSKVLNRVYTTKRHSELKEKYEHWFDLRREALTCEDREKGKAIAKNIDKAELNKAYYDYFFEGFLKNILTTILPMLLTATYISRSYTPENLMKNFGRGHIFKFSGSGGDPLVIGAFFWFVISLFSIYLMWFVVGIAINRYFKKKGKG